MCRQFDSSVEELPMNSCCRTEHQQNISTQDNSMKDGKVVFKVVFLLFYDFKIFAYFSF